MRFTVGSPIDSELPREIFSGQAVGAQGLNLVSDFSFLAANIENTVYLIHRK